MPYASQLLMDDDQNLLDVCLETHMAIHGSSDPLDDNHLAHNLNVLQTAVDNWESSLQRSARFDAAVLELVKATIAEAEQK